MLLDGHRANWLYKERLLKSSPLQPILRQQATRPLYSVHTLWEYFCKGTESFVILTANIHQIFTTREVCEANVLTDVCLSTGGGCAWWRACIAGGDMVRGVCMAGGHAWQRGMCAWGVCMAGGCMAGGVYGGVGGMRGRRDSHCLSWNAFLFTSLFHFLTEFALKRHDFRRLSGVCRCRCEWCAAQCSGERTRTMCEATPLRKSWCERQKLWGVTTAPSCSLQGNVWLGEGAYKCRSWCELSELLHSIARGSRHGIL